jgi:hypothetical protein
VQPRQVSARTTPMAQAGVFPVRLTLPDGSIRKVQCDDSTTVSQILQAVALKLSQSSGRTPQWERLSLSEPGQPRTLAPCDRLAPLGYVRDCLSRGRRPTFRVTESPHTTVGALPQHTSRPDMLGHGGRLPTDEPPPRQDRDRDQGQGQQRRQPLSQTSSSRQLAAAPSTLLSGGKRWAFRVVFELPTGQMATLSCVGELPIAQVKADAHQHWQSTQPSIPVGVGPAACVLRVLDIAACRARGYAGPQALDDGDELQRSSVRVQPSRVCRCAAQPTPGRLRLACVEPRESRAVVTCTDDRRAFAISPLPPPRHTCPSSSRFASSRGCSRG